jgi:hypothetical protein
VINKMNGDETTTQSIERIDALINESSINLVELKAELIALLQHLSAPGGRTDENCKAVDSRFGLADTWLDKDLPHDFHDLLAYMSEALHDTISAPDIAVNFGCTPEQLLETARKLNTEHGSPANHRSPSAPVVGGR